MRRIFADTSFFVGILDFGDQHSSAAFAAFEKLGDIELHTSEAVLTELLAYFSRDLEIRTPLLVLVNRILASPEYVVHPQPTSDFREALKLLSSREDKRYSLTDCASMMIMKREDIQDVLSADHHFAQEGFTKLF